MIRKTIGLGLAALALAPFAAMPAQAQSAPAKVQKIKLDTLKPGKLKLDPRLGYILVRIGPKTSATDNPMSVGFSRFDAQTGKPVIGGDVQGLSADFWRTVAVGVNTGRSFGTTADGAGIYLVSAYPGRWVISSVGASVYGSTCLSMGTYAFDVKQGEISDIGTLLTGREDGQSPAAQLKGAKLSDDLVQFGTLMNIVMTNALYAMPASDDPALPPEMAAMPRSRVTLEPDVRMGNICNDMPNRALSLPPIGHQPPLTAEQARARIDEINPDELVERVAKRKAAEAARAK